VDKEQRENMAFCTPEGLSESNTIPFGLCNVPRLFSEVNGHGSNWATVEQLHSLYQ